MQPKIHKSNADVKHSHTIEEHAAAGEYEYQEYPKVIGRDENDREIVADSAEHEAMLLAELEEPEVPAAVEAGPGEAGEAGEPSGTGEDAEDNKAEAGQ